ncbi:MAG: bifunctional metallophosphatase/5'-nucleotidase [bacterium]|nr:bifunctional metallophosphatase/5'-nucleotidase [bacterium]
MNKKKSQKYINLNKRFYFIAILFILILIHYFYLNQKTSKINIFYTSDGKGVFYDIDSYNKVRGVMPVADYLSTLKYQDFLLFDVGNTIYKNPYTLNDNAQYFVGFMSKMKYDGLCVGESELSWGEKKLMNLASKAEFPLLSCNIELEKDENIKGNVFTPYIIKTIKNTKIGIIGVTDKDIFKNNLEKNIKSFTIKPLFKTLKRYVKLLKEEERVDLIILLSRYNMTHKDEYLSNTFYQVNNSLIADEIQGIDIILAKSIPDEYASKVPDAYISSKNKTIICNSFEGEFKSIGNLEIIIRDKTKTMVSFSNQQIKPTIPAIYLKDKNFQFYDEVQKFKKTINRKYNIILGRTNFLLQKQNIAMLTVDIMKSATNADFAIIKNKDIRSTISKGKIKYRKVIEIFPESQRVVLIKLTGKEILDILELSISDRSSENIVISDLEYKVDEKSSYARITELLSSGRNNFKLDEKYKVAILERMLNSYIDQDIFRKAEKISVSRDTIQELFLNYISTHVPLEPKYSYEGLKKERKNFQTLYEI